MWRHSLHSEKLPEDFTVEKIGIGAGKRQYECPGILRAMLIRESEEEASGNDACTEIDTIIKLESNIDDCTGETLGYVMELLYEAGAREANYMPVFMKKNRPAWLLTVLCKKRTGFQRWSRSFSEKRQPLGSVARRWREPF